MPGSPSHPHWLSFLLLLLKWTMLPGLKNTLKWEKNVFRAIVYLCRGACSPHPSERTFGSPHPLHYSLPPNLSLWEKSRTLIFSYITIDFACGHILIPGESPMKDEMRRWGETSNGDWECVTDLVGEKLEECLILKATQRLKTKETISWAKCSNRLGKTRT